VAFDTIVVGAGPAGSAAAIVAARAGLRVALVDKARFPRDKICGDLLGTWALGALREIGITSDRFATYPALRGARLYTPARASAGASVDPHMYEARVVPRMDFDVELVREAQARGAHFVQARTTGLLRAGDRVVGVSTDTGDLHAPLVIGADGWGSLIARACGIPRARPRDAGIAVRAYVENVAEMDGEMHFFVLPPGDGYAWIFPLADGLANVGLGFVRDEPGADRLHDAFERFLCAPSSPARRFFVNATVGERRAWPLAFGWRGTPLVADGVLLAGDAGSLVSPLSGSGIHHALQSGASAARAAVDALARGDVRARSLRAHERRMRFTVGARLRIESWAHRTIGNPRRIDAFAAALANVPGSNRVLAPLLLNLG